MYVPTFSTRWDKILKGVLRVVACFVLIFQPTDIVVALYKTAIYNSPHNAERNKRCDGESAFSDTSKRKGREEWRVPRRVQCTTVVKKWFHTSKMQHKPYLYKYWYMEARFLLSCKMSNFSTNSVHTKLDPKSNHNLSVCYHKIIPLLLIYYLAVFWSERCHQTLQTSLWLCDCVISYLWWRRYFNKLVMILWILINYARQMVSTAKAKSAIYWYNV